MTKMFSRLTIVALALLSVPVAAPAQTQPIATAEMVVVKSGDLQLKGLFWRPAGVGPFPAVLFNHGWSAASIDLAQAQTVARGLTGPTFAKHGYALLWLFRRGEGLSHDQGTAFEESLAPERSSGGADARARLRDHLLTTEQLDDVLAGVAYLRSRADIAHDRVSVAGHSGGGILAVLAGERDSTLRAVVTFAAAEASWNSPSMRTLLTEAAARVRVPTLLVHAANGNVAPGEAMAAEMERRGQPHLLKIYPPFGKTPQDAHNFVFAAIPQWEAEVFAFLDEHSAARPPANPY
jgi:dienelactone hydrolase